MTHGVEIEVGKHRLIIETGKMAKQADGAVVVRYGDTIVLTTVCSAKELPEEPIDFFPLTVNYMERTYAAGKIPGGFFKREGKPTEKEVLGSRIIDRPIRPLFPRDYFFETQVIAMVLSHDKERDSDIFGIIGASAALMISDIPFNGPVGAVRIGYTDGEFIINPTVTELEDSLMNMVVAGTETAITTIEGSFREVSEEVVEKALEIAHREIKRIVEVQKRFALEVGKPKREFTPLEVPETLEREIEKEILDDIRRLNNIPDKLERKEFFESIIERVKEKYPEDERIIHRVVEDIRKREMRRQILEEGKRVDGRTPDEIRPISCEIGLLPRVHGSALFTRGQTQALCTVTLGTKEDEQRIEELIGEGFKSFMVHYNFPPFSTGEIRPLRAPGRREIGHGALAERSLLAVIPSEDEFPYTIRVVSDILESNGSSSMATVCGASLAMMDCGIPIKRHVAGVALGLVKEDDRFVILTDIAGDEDHYGDMDFKVAGTRQGITGIQLDTKIQNLTLTELREALRKAREARYYILDIMEMTIKEPRPDVSRYAPKLYVMNVPKNKIGDIIGPGGKVIRGIIDETGAKVEITPDGKVVISGPEREVVEKAAERIRNIVEDVEIGQVFTGRVTRVAPFGAFVEIRPGKEGLVHISQLAPYRIKRVEDVVKVGDEIVVKVIGVDDLGRISLSRKAVLENKP
ncbi:polyribonucleotide nucleotidyltransferase [bacterium]|nr:MAG: polyribonucleotide nucleotidyltransferase [bacterium]